MVHGPLVPGGGAANRAIAGGCPGYPETMSEIVELIRRRACLAEARDAERIAHAVLRTLSERISPEAAASLAVQLPPELAEDLRPGGGSGERFELEDFVGRIAERGKLTDPEAVHRAGVVLDVLGRETVHVADEVWNVLPEPMRHLVGADRFRVA